LRRLGQAAAAGSSRGRTGPAGPHHLLTPSGVLRLQRTAGNEAVSGALTIQRKRVKEMMEFGNGVIYGEYDPKNKMLNIGGASDSWINS